VVGAAECEMKKAAAAAFWLCFVATCYDAGVVVLF